MPYPNEHAARLRDPADFKDKPDWSDGGKFRRTKGGTIFGHIKVPASISIIWGQLKSQSGDQAAPQSLRFPKDQWSVDEAKAWLEKNKVSYKSFEPAADSKSEEPAIDNWHYSALCDDPIEIREDDGGGRRLVGYAAVYYRKDDPGTEYQLGKRVRERIAPGAFDEAIERDEVVALFNHSQDQVLGRKSAGTLRLSTNKRGLVYEVLLPPTTLGNDLAALVRRGDIRGSSFAFIPVDEQWTKLGDDGEVDVRTIRSVKLIDVSPVTFPAYESTTVKLASRMRQEREAAEEAKRLEMVRCRLRLIHAKLRLQESLLR